MCRYSSSIHTILNFRVQKDLVQTSTIQLQHGWFSCCCTIHCWAFYIMTAVIWNIALSILFACCLFFFFFARTFLNYFVCGYYIGAYIEIIFPNRKCMKYWLKWRNSLVQHQVPYRLMMMIMMATHHLPKLWEERQVVVKI